MNQSVVEEQPGLELPPAIENGSGKTRTVGIEIEFGQLEGEAAAYLVADHFGGRVRQLDAHAFGVEGSRFGDFKIELDMRYAHYAKRNEGLLDEAGALLSSLVGDAAKIAIPYEIATPPIPVDRLGEMEPLVRRLREAGASGTEASMLYAFALHFNPETPALDTDAVAAVLKAYGVLSPWLWERVNPDPTRRLLGFAEPYPESYVRKLADHEYWPELCDLIDDYLEANPTRNRDLDLLPLLAFLDEDRVRAALPDEKINPRPTFHYRLPDSRLDQADWSLALEWNRWVAVERLANDRERLRAVCEAYLREPADSASWAGRLPDLAFA